MERIDKILKILRTDERERVILCIEKILAGNTALLDIKKLKGQQYFYRARIGDLRIIFTKKEGAVHIVALEKRGDNTYRRF
jgi:mRNA-degrading endonuclease RelE of RelBE toxin-antitoxin system